MDDSSPTAVSPPTSFQMIHHGVAGMFVYDAANNATILASVNTAGDAGAADRSLKPVFSADGRTLFFESWAADISGNDFNNGSDMFALDLTALPLTTGTGDGATNAASGFVAQLIFPPGRSFPIPPPLTGRSLRAIPIRCSSKQISPTPSG